MKLFGWGKSKHLQPQTVLQPVQNSDPRKGRHGPDRGTSMGPRMPCKGTSTGIRIKQQGLFPGVDDDGYLHSASPKQNASSSEKDASVSEEKLQDTIRFVFSNEHEGLLAIGTFALEQLAAVRNAIDEHKKVAVAGGQVQNQDGFESRTGMMQSSDDEDSPPWSWLHNARKNTCELPVYAADDVDTSGVESGAEEGPNEEKPCALKGFNRSKVLTLYKSSGNRTPIAGVKPIVLLTALPPELRKPVFDRANLIYSKSQLPTFVPHWTDSVPITPVLATDEESYFASRFCGLFGFRKKTSSKSKRLSKRGTVYLDTEESQEQLSTKVIDQDVKKSIFDFGTNGMPSLGKLAKMWRSSCKQSSARIAPERKPCESPRPYQEFMGPHCAAYGNERGEVLTALAPQPHSQNPARRLPTDACSQKVAEFRRRVAMRERNNVTVQTNAAHPAEVVSDGVESNCGHWVKTDSEFVVLEM